MAQPNSSQHVWSPGAFFEDLGDNSSIGDLLRFEVVIVLNTPIERLDILTKVSARASLVIAVDGGANRIFDLGSEYYCFPNVIVGDLDSIRDEVRADYEQKGVHFFHDGDQYATDSFKAFKYLSRSYRTDHPVRETGEMPQVLVFGGLGGRVDQAFSQLNTLYLIKKDQRISNHVGRVYLMAGESVVWLLHPGINTIHTPRNKGFFGESVGIIPLGEPAVITTKGLEWDVEDWPTVFGSNVSTSNHVRADKVMVRTDKVVLFSLELKS